MTNHFSLYHMTLLWLSLCVSSVNLRFFWLVWKGFCVIFLERMVECFVVKHGPAVRYYGGLPTLRADTWVGWADTWVCPTSPPYHYHQVYFGEFVRLWWAKTSLISMSKPWNMDSIAVVGCCVGCLFGSNVEMQGILKMPCNTVQDVRKWKASQRCHPLAYSGSMP